MIVTMVSHTSQEPWRPVTALPDHTLWRTNWLAQLEYARARLWWVYTGLSADLLTGPPVWEDWTAQDVLVHLAYWDSRAAEWMQRAADGRLDAAPPPLSHLDYASQNARQHQRHTTITLDAALAMCLKERQGFLNAWRAAPDSRLDVEILWSGQLIPLRTLVQWRAKHDAAHAADVARWRIGWSSSDGPVAILLAALRAWRRTIKALIPLQAMPDSDLGRLAAWAAFVRRSLISSPLPAWESLPSEPTGAVSWQNTEEEWRTLTAAVAVWSPDDLTQAQPVEDGRVVSRYGWLIEGQPLAAKALAELFQRLLPRD